MRQKIFVVLVLVVLLLGSSLLFSGRFSHSAQAEERLQPMSIGNLPPLVKISQKLGADQSNRTLQMSIGLSLRNQDQLNTLLQSLYDPSSSSYHQFLSVNQFASEFAPTTDQQQAVINYLTSQGFTITQTYPNHTLIDFGGPQSLAERVFGVSINDYRSPDGRDFFANASQPSLPAYLASYVTNISGLDDANQFYHPPIASKNAPAISPNAGSNCPAPGQSGGSGGGGILGGGSQVAYIPSQFAKAYNYDGLHSAGLQGEGQTVGVFELDGYSQSDIQAYAQCFGGGSVPIQNVVLDGFNGQPGAGAIEVELDVEMILSQAPHLSKLIVYEAPNTTQGYNDEFARIVSDKTPVISVSWGDCESNMGQQEANQENQYFQEAAAQGQTILVAAGDSGSSSCFQLQGGGFNTSLNADDPAAQPYVTGVGGTNLTLNSDNSYASETVWNGGFLGGAGGGGISQFWKQPSWQKGPGVQNSYSNGMRETPDVSLDADPATGYPVYCTAGSSCSSSGGLGGGSGWITVGGTSAAAPMWAAMIALANEEAAHHGKGPLGFLNPALYKIAAGSRYGSDFHDITPPSNSSAPSNNDELGINGGAYPVTNNYDIATGWGTFNATNLAADLVAMR
ncbi:MAG TPA: S53 family peptidase [Ktedonobacteraceae bacterium]|nr:S53 family peptidase [Ktedonobacteraceae bacterium]